MLGLALGLAGAYVLGRRMQARKNAQEAAMGGGFDFGGIEPWQDGDEFVGQLGQGGMVAEFSPSGAGQVQMQTPFGTQVQNVAAPGPVQYYGPAGAAFPMSGGAAPFGWGAYPYALAAPAGLASYYGPAGGYFDPAWAAWGGW